MVAIARAMALSPKILLLDEPFEDLAPVEISAFYLKDLSPPHVTISQIFARMMSHMLIVILCLVFMYIWPGMTLWLPEFLYGG